MNKKTGFIMFCILFTFIESIVAQMSTTFFENRDLLRITSYTDGKKKITRSFTLIDDNTMHIELSATDREGKSYSYISQKMIWNKNTLHTTIFDGNNNITYEEINTYNDLGQKINIVSTHYQSWGEITDIVNTYGNYEYDENGNLIYSEDLNSFGQKNITN